MAKAILRHAAAAAALAAALSAGCTASASAQSATTDKAVKRFENSIVTAQPPEATKFTAAPLPDNVRRTATLQLHFGLATRNIGELQARVAQGERIPPAELAAKYSGDPESAKRLARWLSQQGFRGIETSADNTSIYATATVDQIEKSLGVTMKNVTYNGKTMPAATSAPALPQDVGDAVIAIGGLQPWVHAVKHILPRSKGLTAADPKPVKRPDPCGVLSKNAGAYKLYDILKAYNAYGLDVPGKGAVTGKGQTIAILIDTFPLMTDVQSFWQRNGLANNPSRIQQVHVTGGTALPLESDENHIPEATLDVEWASGIAPEAVVRVYAPGSIEDADVYRALERIYADAQKPNGPRHLSLSFVGFEDPSSSGQQEMQSALFHKLAALGVATFVSSGDWGSNPTISVELGEFVPGGPKSLVQYPASDPSVIAVGGTVLHFDAQSGKVVSEKGWSFSGGGVSESFPRPAWQRPDFLPEQKNRLVPDVSSVASARPGAFLIRNGKECAVGGTSWSAPMWAGFSALIAEAREKQGKPPLGFLAPHLYRLPANTGFRDITDGSNGAFKAGPGWDPVTGLGVPDVKALILALP